MLLLIFIVFSQQSIDIETVRDSVVHQVVVGRFQDAIENAKSAIVCEPNDCLLLGVIEYAFRRDIIHDLNNKFRYRISNIYPKEIIRSWEKIYDKHLTSNNVAELLAVIALGTEEEKAIYYAQDVVRRDTTNSFSYLLLGYLHEAAGECDQAIICYKKAFIFDPTFYDCAAALANLYIASNAYDSALHYLRDIPFDDTLHNTAHVAELVCALKMNDRLRAKSILNEMEKHTVRYWDKDKLDSIGVYFSKLTEGNLTADDSLFVPIIVRLNKIRCMAQTALVALLHQEYVEFINMADNDYFKETRPKPLSIPAPKYPEQGKTAGQEGIVVVKALIDLDGSVAETQILFTDLPPFFEDVAEKAARKAEFEPAKRFGRPVKVWVSLPYKFRLN